LALSGDGSRLFVGAPQFGEDPSAVYGMVQVYDFDGTAWVQVGKDLAGDTPGGRFGSSISADNSGVKAVVGAPLIDIAVLEEEAAGQIRAFFFEELIWSELLENGLLYASRNESQLKLGSQVAIHCTGDIFASGGRDYELASSSKFGTVRFWHYLSEVSVNLMGSTNYASTSGILPVNDFLSGSHEGEHLGYDIGMDCGDSLTWIASSENQGGRAGIALVAGFEWSWTYKNIVNTEFPGPELGDTAWFGKGPRALQFQGWAIDLLLVMRASGPTTLQGPRFTFMTILLCELLVFDISVLFVT
jgi:hypothetical protein